MKVLIVNLLLLFVLFFSPFHASTIILTSDKQLNDHLDPDIKKDLSIGRNKRYASLREICETAQKNGDKTLTIVFDEFFRQYWEQACIDRKLTPDMDEYVYKIKVIVDFAAKYQMGTGLSLLNPLELGPAYKKHTGESGRWVNYISNSPLYCPVVVIFGHACTMNWDGPSYDNVGIEIVDRLGEEGIPTDLIPSSEIENKNILVDQEGWIRYGDQRYAAVILYHPEFGRSIVTYFFNQAAKGKSSLYKVGDWKKDFNGDAFKGNELLPLRMIINVDNE